MLSNLWLRFKISNHSSKTSSRENLLPKDVDKAKKSDSTNEHDDILKGDSIDKDFQIAGSRHNTREAYSTELLDGVEDIDSKDEKSPLLMGIYIKDIYNYLMELEMLYPINEQHLEGQVSIIFLLLYHDDNVINWNYFIRPLSRQKCEQHLLTGLSKFIINFI